MTIPEDIILAVKSTAVRCPICGAKPGHACYGNGEMRVAHPTRSRIARDQAIADWSRNEAFREAAAIASDFDRGNQTEHFQALDRLAQTIAQAILDAQNT